VKFVTSDGRKLTYRKLGHGPMLVCHPGGPGFSSTYLGDLAGLWEQYTLIMLNPRGTAASDRPADRADYRLDDYVSDLEEVRQHLALDRMLLLGYSHGGLVAQAYAAEHRDRVERLVLAATAARFGPEQTAATQAAKEKRSGQPWYPDAVAAGNEADALDSMTDEQLRDIVFRQMPFYFARFGPAEAGYLDTFSSETINADALTAFGEQMPSLDLRDRIAAITAPTLVITGDEDFICGPVCAREITAAIPGAREVIIGDAGHMVFVEQAQAFHDEVADFLGAS
jgi:proline-specific peptidase